MKGIYISVMLAALLVALFAVCMVAGAVDIPVNEVMRILTGRGSDRPSWEYIVQESRLPQAITATLCGGALSVSGLLLQTVFHNPLAGPSIFGINSGASLGVALVLLLMGGSVSAAGVELSGFIAILTAAFVGAMLVLLLILGAATVVRNHVMLLIVGIMVGYLSNSAISLLNFFATEEGVQSYMVWGMGNFGGVSMKVMPYFATVSLSCIAASLLFIKPLNALLLGEEYAENLGFNTLHLRNWMLLLTGVLAAITTAFCGPIAFIGLAVPHVARMMLGTDNHKPLLPVTILTGSCVALLCNIICVLPGDLGVIPLNAVTPVMGAPVIIYVIARRRG